jgi:hypothetical protein
MIGQTMSTLIGTFGDGFTQTVQGVFPNGGLGTLTNIVIKTVNTVIGQGLVNDLMEAEQHISKTMYSGSPFPGTVKIYDDKIDFIPSFWIKLPIYQGIEALSFSYQTIQRIEKTGTGFFKLPTVKLVLDQGEFLIVAPFAARKIIDMVQPLLQRSQAVKLTE